MSGATGRIFRAFLSTLSLRRATLKPPIQTHRQKHFYPRSPCGERRSLVIKLPFRSAISIHALLAESDLPETTPCPSRGQFLSTLSLRRATHWYHINKKAAIDFYPRSPCGERPITCCPPMPHAVFLSTLSLRRATFTISAHCFDGWISIHALLAESDHANRYYVGLHLEFLSTLSLRRATHMNSSIFPGS